MRILHLVPGVGPKSFGLGQVALNLVKAQAALGHDPLIWCLEPAAECMRAAEAAAIAPKRIRPFPRIGPALIGLSLAMHKAAGTEGGEFEVVHQHGLWTAVSHVTLSLSRRHHCPTVVAPHGSLQGAVLRKSWWKKRLASLAYETANLRGAACLHATAPTEVEDFRRYGLRNPIALITNGVSDRWLGLEGNGTRFREACGIPEGPRICLFMSRIAPKKGLPILLRAWARLSSSSSGWILVVVGDDEDGHKAEVGLLSAQLGLSGRVRFVASTFGQGARDAFAAAELFVLPSYSEGFPMVVLDALGAGVPAIVTKGSSWKDLETHRCGWWVDASPEGIEKALAVALALPGEKLRRMGAAGRALVTSRYSWSTLAGQTLEVYRWLCGFEVPPVFVATL